MGKKIITIARQTGSGGHEIGERLAEKFNIPFHDRNIIDKALKELNELGIPGVEFKAETAQKCGITGTHMHVLVNGEEESEHISNESPTLCIFLQ